MLNLKSQCSLLHSHVNHRYSGNVRGLALFLDIYRAYNKFNKTTEGHQTDVILNFSHDFWVFGIARLQEFTAGWVSIKVHSYHVDLSENMAPLSIQSLIIILIYTLVATKSLICSNWIHTCCQTHYHALSQ